MTETLKDKAIKGFKSPEDFIGFIEMMEAVSEWKDDVNIEDVTFQCFSTEDVRGKSEQWLDTATDGTKLFITYEGMTYPVRDCAMQSVLERVGATCNFINSVTPERRAELLSEAATVVNERGRNRFDSPVKKGIISIVDGKISAFLSDSKSKIGYQKQEQSKFMRDVHERVLNDGGVEDFDGFFTFNGCDATWVSNQEVILKDENNKDVLYNVEIHASSSDVGKGALHCSARLNDGFGCIIPVGEEKIPHRKALTAQDVTDAIDKLNKQINRRSADLDELKKVIVQYPEGCLKKIIKEFELPLKIGTAVVDSYIETFGKGKATAYTLFLVLCQINGRLKEVRPEKFDFRNKEEAIILKTLSKSVWEKYDSPLF